MSPTNYTFDIGWEMKWILFNDIEEKKRNLYQKKKFARKKENFWIKKGKENDFNQKKKKKKKSNRSNRKTNVNFGWAKWLSKISKKKFRFVSLTDQSINQSINQSKI